MTDQIAQFRALKDDLELLEEVLEQEFVVLKNQDMDGFDALHTRKEAIIARISGVNLGACMAILKDDNVSMEVKSSWSSVEELGAHCRKLQKRNEVLIDKKLSVVTEALNSLRYPHGDSPQNFYSQKGKLTEKL
jgi:flagellar biosynthesis/type III secretory pathway chaperone